MVVARKYNVVKTFHKNAKKEDFQIVEEELPSVQSGEILVKTEWISVDPYQRAFQGNYQIPYVQFGYNTGTVLQSKDENFPVGSKVVSHEGWCDHFIVNPSLKESPMEKVYKVPNLQKLSTSLAIGAVGMHGATAYFSVLDNLQAKSGETLLVTCAAGAVGSLVGQIAKIKGCKVIGITGSDIKVHWLEKELGFDKAINYKKVDIASALKEFAPEGIDCFFDGVGGEISSSIMSQMNQFGRVCAVGWVSGYNAEEMTKATIVQPSIIGKLLTVKGFIVWQYFESWPKAFDQMIQWIKSGQIKVREHIVEGFDKVFDAFEDVMDGVNAGKAIVKVESDLRKY